MDLDRDVFEHLHLVAVGGRDVAGDEDGVLRRFLLGVLDRADRDEGLGIVLCRAVDDRLGGVAFDALAVAQHQDLVRDLGHDGKVVGDVERGDAGIGDRLLDRRQNVDLGGDIKRRRRFVEDDEVGFGDQRHDRHRALQLAARNLMRIAATEGFGVGQAEPGEQVDGATSGLFLAGDAVGKCGLGDLFHQLLGRVEGGGGGLRDIGDFLAAQPAQAARAALEDVAAVQPDLAPGDADAAAAIAHGGKADGGLARAGFADQAQHLALFQREGHVIDDGDVAGGFAGGIDRRLDAKVADVEEGISHRGPLSGRRCGSAPSRPPC